MKARRRIQQAVHRKAAADTRMGTHPVRATARAARVVRRARQRYQDTGEPDDGIPPIEYWSYLGKKADRDYAANEALEP